jgi:hypothetical protein
MRRATSKASAGVGGDAVVGLVEPELAIISVKSLRSSARSIDSTDVPISGAPALCRPWREVQRRLAAELHDDAVGLHRAHDGHHVLVRQRLEEQVVARVVVGRDGLRVRVDHDRLEPISRTAKAACTQQ